MRQGAAEQLRCHGSCGGRLPPFATPDQARHAACIRSAVQRPQQPLRPFAPRERRGAACTERACMHALSHAGAVLPACHQQMRLCHTDQPAHRLKTAMLLPRTCASSHACAAWAASSHARHKRAGWPSQRPAGTPPPHGEALPGTAPDRPTADNPSLHAHANGLCMQHRFIAMASAAPRSSLRTVAESLSVQSTCTRCPA